MRNILTIDLEDYYHVSAFSSGNPLEQWSSRQSRLERNTHELLDLFDEVNCKATFFVLAWIAEHQAGIISEIARRGHEVACHSFAHRTVYALTRQEFRNDTRKAKTLLENAIGAAVYGYRAPSFSITKDSLWAFEILAELGFTFDSSIFPVRHPSYGIPDAPRAAYRIHTPSGSIVEFPMTTLDFAGRRTPFGGGAYFRFLPYWYTAWGIQFLNESENRPVCVYLHPWELDPEQPKLEGGLTAKMRHYIGLRRTASKFKQLLRNFEFGPIGPMVDSV